MKKGIITLAGGVLFALLVGFSSGGQVQSTGAPDEQTCGNSSCHNVDPNTGSAMLKLELTGTTETYEADATYSLKVSLEDVQAAKNGFQIVALDEANNNAGTWTLTDTDAMKELAGNILADRKYVTHTSNGNAQAEWSLDWTAPSSDVGAVTFYVSAIDADGNGAKSGDNLYTTSSSLSFATVSGLESLAARQIALYPNPASDYIYIENMPQDVIGFRIYDVQGKLIQQPAFLNKVDVSQLQEGLYFLQLQTKEELLTKQFLVH